MAGFHSGFASLQRDWKRWGVWIFLNINVCRAEIVNSAKALHFTEWLMRLSWKLCSLWFSCHLRQTVDLQQSSNLTSQLSKHQLTIQFCLTGNYRPISLNLFLCAYFPTSVISLSELSGCDIVPEFLAHACPPELWDLSRSPDYGVECSSCSFHSKPFVVSMPTH